MASEPVTLFARTGDPAVVLKVLRSLNAACHVVGPDHAWTEIVVTTGRWFNKKQLRITHDPAYYAGEGWQRQLAGMRGYLSRFSPGAAQARVLALTAQFGFVLGTICEPDAHAGDERYQVLAAIAEALDAVWFTPSSLRDAKGRVLYGADPAAFDPAARWPAYAPSLQVQNTDSSPAAAMQQQDFNELTALGFQPASSLPPPELHAQMCSAEVICRRLMSLHAIFAWAAMPAHIADTSVLLAYIARSDLRGAMTESELALITLPRAEANALYAGSVGWRLENMWPLAWILGFERSPTLDASQISDEIISATLFDFLPGLDGTVEGFAPDLSLRQASELIYMEYKFYCAHNAVRSAQLGGKTVPAGFDPIAHGGAIHERRHALTWALSTDTAWDDTDLST